MRGEEGVGQPPGAGHDGWGGGEKEEGVEGLEDGGVGVEDEESGVLGLLEGEEFGVAVCPVGAGIYCKWCVNITILRLNFKTNEDEK